MVFHTSTQTSSAPRASVSGGNHLVWRKITTALLLAILGVFLVRLGLLVFSPDLAGNTGQAGAPATAISHAVDIGALQSGQLFGTRKTDASGNAMTQAARLTNSPPAAGATRLNLRLDGVVTGSSPASGMAIIASNNQAGTYQIGDRLPAGNRVILNAIYPDRVILENNGNTETLWLYAREQDAGVVMNNAVSTRRAAAAGNFGSAGVSSVESYDPIAMVKQYREKLQNNALSADFLTLSEIVRISPVHENSQMLGYSVSPGEYKTEFIRLGLKTNDIVTSINGIALTDIGNMPKLFEVMSTAENITLTLIRDRQPVDLQLALSELPR